METENKEDIKQIISRIFNFGEDLRSESAVIESIAADVDFYGAKLWLLVIAVFVASLGLNINSTAVIIGAMLISPLMGPIIGIGLSVGIYDFGLLKKSIRNYLIATLFSVVTATLYFWITPISEAQSELLARTSPSIYDVGIALCGGLAGMIGVSSRSQRLGNVIPGVAIATALMPPLCTVGYGIANMKGSFIFGALYLYLINTVFIAFGTCLCISVILKFKKKTLVDKEREGKVRKYIAGIALATIIPSIFLTLGIVQDTVFEQRVGKFVHDEMNFSDSQVVRFNFDRHTKEVQVMLLGNAIDSTMIKELQARLTYYKLDGVTLNIIQGNSKLNEMELLAFLRSREQFFGKDKKEEPSTKKETATRANPALNGVDNHVLKEIRNFYPSISSMIVAEGTILCEESSDRNTLPIFVCNSEIEYPQSDIEKIKSWLKSRLDLDSVLLVTMKTTRIDSIPEIIEHEHVRIDCR